MKAYDKYDILDAAGKYRGTLNSRLVLQQQLTDSAIEEIKETHIEKWHLFDTAKSTTDITTLRKLAAQFEQLEFKQQRLWGFPETTDHHRFFDFPGCSCPHMDNQDRLGTPYRVYNQQCVIHGTQETA